MMYVYILLFKTTFIHVLHRCGSPSRNGGHQQCWRMLHHFTSIKNWTTKSKNGPTRDIWYKSGPLGKNKIATLLPDACKLTGIEKRNNHGERATAVIRLRKGGLPDDKIIQITGHKSIHSLSSYDNERMDVIERQQCQNVLLNSARPPNASSTVSADHSCYIPSGGSRGGRGGRAPPLPKK